MTSSCNHNFFSEKMFQIEIKSRVKKSQNIFLFRSLKSHVVDAEYSILQVEERNNHISRYKIISPKEVKNLIYNFLVSPYHSSSAELLLVGVEQGTL